MRVSISAIGRLKAGAERQLIDRYHDRAAKAGAAVGITKTTFRETPESRAQNSERRRSEEADALISNISSDAAVIALDETGRSLTSRKFADWVAERRDAGISELVILIGGPDGHGPSVKARADLVLSLGAMTYPHQIARLLITEQLYRAITILSGHPYHRD